MVGCSCQTNPYIQSSDNIKQIKTPVDLGEVATQFSSILFQTENKIYYKSISNGALSIWVYKVSDKTATKVGEINNFLIANTSVAESDGKIYFFVTTSTLLGKTNNFYSIDISTDKFKKVYDESLYQSFNYLISFNEKIYILKGDKKSDDAVTFIETYSPSSSKRAVVKEVTANHNKKTGEVILNIAFDDGKFYIYSQKYINQELYYYFDIYDEHFVLKESKEIDVVKYSDIFASAISRFSVKNNNLYVQNFSNASLLEDMNQKNEAIITNFEKPLWLSYRFSNQSPWIMYYRGEPDIYILDENGELKKSDKLDVEDGYAVNMVTQGKDNVLIHLKRIDNSEDKKLVLYKYTDLF